MTAWTSVPECFGFLYLGEHEITKITETIVTKTVSTSGRNAAIFGMREARPNGF
jgi:hypothetical protein